jgi:tetratricopeptide (TPR) repeat protein
MIVKNESKVIVRLLTSVLPLIDTYCICDTGSTDDTISIITEFFNAHSIDGKIFTEPFRDFGYNRTIALKQCYGMQNADYILLMDADMVLEVPVGFSITDFKMSLTDEAYYVVQGSPSFFYKNIRILKNVDNLSYWGVTHEYVSLPTGSKTTEILRTSLFINDIGDGGAKTDKYTRDIRLLLQGLVDNPDNDRYTFYLANSYRDAGQYQNAIDTYRKRIELGGWKEEVWFSYYAIGTCYNKLNDMPNAIFNWLEGFQYYSERIENLYEIVHYYRLQGKNTLAYQFYKIADTQRNIYTSTDHLFYQKDVYDYKLDYEFSIIGYYCNVDREHSIKSCMKVLNCSNVEKQIRDSVMRNYKYYVQSIRDVSIQTEFSMQLNNIQTEPLVGDEFVSSTPSICMDNNNVYINTRCVDYRIDQHGVYTNKPTITTKNIITIFDKREPVWKKTGEFLLKYNEAYDDVYVGIEDIRLIPHDGGIHFNANRGLAYGHITIETGIVDLSNQKAISKLAVKHNIKPVEKNWVLFSDNAKLNVIYKWYPLTIGEYTNNDDGENSTITFTETNTIQTPEIFRWFRGSTNGVVMDDEIWFMVHLVSDETRRYYYHVFVILDRNTYAVKRYTVPFSFEKEKIEYTLGFVYMKENDQFLIGYSTNDCTTKYMVVPKKNITMLLSDYTLE